MVLSLLQWSEHGPRGAAAEAKVEAEETGRVAAAERREGGATDTRGALGKG